MNVKHVDFWLVLWLNWDAHEDGLRWSLSAYWDWLHTLWRSGADGSLTPAASIRLKYTIFVLRFHSLLYFFVPLWSVASASVIPYKQLLTCSTDSVQWTKREKLCLFFFLLLLHPTFITFLIRPLRKAAPCFPRFQAFSFPSCLSVLWWGAGWPRVNNRCSST